MVRSQPREIILETLSWKNLSQKGTGEVSQGVSLEFKTQYSKKKSVHVLAGGNLAS
jgi:hypothetical protein